MIGQAIAAEGQTRPKILRIPLLFRKCHLDQEGHQPKFSAIDFRKNLPVIPNTWRAAEAGNVKDVFSHLEAWANMDATDHSYGNPCRRSGVVNPLKGRGAGVKSRANICAETALYVAAEGAYEAIVAALLDTGTGSEP